MATLNLLNINVDSLFEHHSVTEIDAVHKKIQEVVENKREDLRTMVGERYRDLLEAADTITAMQESTKALIKQIDNINGNCKNLNEQQLLGFKTESDSIGELKSRNSNKQLNNYFSTMIQIKLLTSLPELIWSQLDSEQYYAATELFIFSRHISTGLQLDSHNALLQKLPVAKKQWEIIKPFHMTIKQRVMAALERENLSPELTVDCILSLLQLDRCTLESAIKTFLNLRCNAFLYCLSADSERVKERILSSLKILNDSLDMVAKCFLDGSLLSKKLSEYVEQNAPPTIERMSNDDVQFAYLLPDIIVNFKPKFEAVAISNEAMRALIEQFLADTQHIASNQLKQLFDLVVNMNSIQEIKIEANSLKKQIDFNALATQFTLTQSLDFYDIRYVPLINQRIRNIINDSWSKTINQTYICLENALKQVDKVNTKQYSLWQEFPSDLPNSLDQALSGDLKIKKLLMKSKGYNNKVIEIATEFDNNLSGIIKEMNILLEEPTTKLEDKLALIEFLRDTSQQHITEFITKVKGIQMSECRQSLIFVIRCCCALVELCPHLKMCFLQSAAWRELLGATSSSSSAEHWQRICGLMKDEIYTFWMHLVNGLLEEFSCERYLINIQSLNVILEDFASWELITLEQKDDQNMPVQSSFRIPTQPRISLQSYLQILINALKNIVPETLPFKVLQTFNHKLIDKLVKHYQQLVQDHPTTVTQNIALQLYFDIKFLQSSFTITREQKEELTALQNTYKDLIDPFDFELFSSQLMANIKRSVLRSNCILGVLTSLNMPTSQTGAVVQEKDPNVLSLCSSGSTSLWFPLLPVVSNNVTSTITTNQLENRKPLSESPKTTPTRKSTSSRKSDTKAKSGAVSFFGAMSQEWFR